MERDAICSKFLESLTHELYAYQEEALLSWFGSDRGLLICAPTGMGKTLLAEAAIFEALHSDQRLYYTTPLIALTDQKYREFQDKAEVWGFPRDRIGLVTGNRRENPDAPIRIVVAEILLNHLLEGESSFGDVSAVVIDEFHYFNDPDRGIVWELSLVLLPPRVRLMLLSATVGNPVEFVGWLKDEHGRDMQLIQSQERKVPLEFTWVGDKLLTEHLPAMVATDDKENRSPALVFCFNRDECWEVAERLKGVKLTDPAARAEIEKVMDREDFVEGVGPKLRQMLICGVGVHHAGVLPKHKEVVEKLFLMKLIPFVVCTETLAAGINLPARSVVLTTLLKGKPGERKLIFSSTAHQMFGRAGRPQFDTQGYVYAMAHEDDARIARWKKKFDQIDPNSKDPNLMRLRKEMEKKRPTRRKTEQYWSEGQFRTLIAAGPAKLFSRSMIPYRVLIYLLNKTSDLHGVRQFLSKRFTTGERIQQFHEQLNHMIGNLAHFGYLTRAEDDRVTLHDGIHDLLSFRSIDPLYGAYLVKQLVRADLNEKVQALESLLTIPPVLERLVRLPWDLPPGPLRPLIEPRLVQLGLVAAKTDSPADDEDEEEDNRMFGDEEEQRYLTLPEILKALFDAMLPTPEDVIVQPKWMAGGVMESNGDFYKFVRNRNLVKNEGLVLRHLLRLVILTGEFSERSGGDPEYAQIGEAATKVCQQVDPRYTDRFLSAEEEAKKLALA